MLAPNSVASRGLWSHRRTAAARFRCSANRFSLHAGRQRRWFASPLSASDVPTTDATFRYRTFEWETSLGKKQEYEYITIQQPAGGGPATSALSAVEEHLPRPRSGWSIALIPSVSLVCSGKEEMRPLASMLSQRGHRCYILEWPGWTSDLKTNFALERCRLQDLSSEYHDFWCQLLEHLAKDESNETLPCRDGVEKSTASSPRLCVVGAGHSALYAMRALQTVASWQPPQSSHDSAGDRSILDGLASLVMLSPTWKTTRRGLVAACLQPSQASYFTGYLLNMDSRFGRWFRTRHLSRRQFRKHFVHRAASEAERLKSIAAWLFQRPRPYTETDAAILHGHLDPSESSHEEGLADEMESLSTRLSHGILLVSSESAKKQDRAFASQGPRDGAERLAEAVALANSKSHVQHCEVAVSSPIPHEVNPSAVAVILDQWLMQEEAVQ